MHCNLLAVQDALAAGADPNEADAFGSTPLLKASSKANSNINGTSCVQVVDELIKNGHADVNKKGNSGETPLIRAAKDGHLEVVKELIALGADINATDNRGRTALDLAIQLERNEVADALKKAVGGVPAVGGGRRKTRHRRISRRHRRASRRSRRR